MNTKEAVSKYGLWAVIAAVAATIRLKDQEGVSVEYAFRKAEQSTRRDLRSEDNDGHYHEEIPPMMYIRSRSRG
jgi:hypothetical protein